MSTTTGDIRIHPSDLETIVDMLSNGQKIPAIKGFRAVTNSGLKEAKDAIDDVDYHIRTRGSTWDSGDRAEAMEQLKNQVVKVCTDTGRGVSYRVVLDDRAASYVTGPGFAYTTTTGTSSVVPMTNETLAQRITDSIERLSRQQNRESATVSNTLYEVAQLLRENNELLKDIVEALSE
jgi:hypothetical protein